VFRERVTDRVRPEVVWLLAVLLLVLGPSVLATLRTATYEASVQTVLIVGSRLPRLEDRAEHVRLVLATEPIPQQIAAASGLLINPEDVPGRVTVTTLGRTIRLTASAGNPGDAALLVNTAGAVLERASRGEIVALGRAQQPPFESSVDRLVERLPGTTPPVPHPIFVGAVGFVIALLLYYAWVSTYAGPGRGRERASPRSESA